MYVKGYSCSSSTQYCIRLENISLIFTYVFEHCTIRERGTICFRLQTTHTHTHTHTNTYIAQTHKHIHNTNQTLYDIRLLRSMNLIRFFQRSFVCLNIILPQSICQKIIRDNQLPYYGHNNNQEMYFYYYLCKNKNTCTRYLMIPHSVLH